MKSTSLNCLKYMVFFFNLLIFICGIAALSVGVWALVNENSFEHILQSKDWFVVGIYITIAVGAALFLIGFLGCCGAIKENRCMLGTFFVIVLVIFIAQLAGAIVIYVKRNVVLTEIGKSIGRYGDNTTEGQLIKKGWDFLQGTVKCCGENNYHDWKNNSEWRNRNRGKSVPNSCCISHVNTINATSNCQTGDEGYVHKDGCAKKLKKYIKIVGIVVGVILIVELLAMIFACCLYKHSNDYGEIA